ncbi:hypothetical protein EX895_004686 [Sporisorium graminicola]|uniref:Autophagy-related protein 13 n=1 Tax=Sporisorium graminicola TaxID=280036 RepID=A0A4U7KRH5_9BASI|nr:hypothetical protein EX895_004686 [Sporisorium graminicola]TKY86537.1 hypothetical protein EX895_004686 [Sporisorium graminicola]
MQPQPHEPLQHRHISSAHSRHPTSSSSIGAPGSSQTIDSQQQQQQQDEASASLQRRPSYRHDLTGAPGTSTAPAANQLTKLDGVIYHFYTTTANLIIQSRLAHLRSFLLTAPFDGAPPTSSVPGSSSSTRLSRWFGLHIPDSDLFKDELRLWRSVTSLLGLDANSMDLAASPPAIPDLVIDVMLDVSAVSDRHHIVLDTSSHPSATSNRRICIDGRRPGDPTPSSTAERPQRIVLEQWRLHFDPTQSATPPDLSTFYKRSVVHFRTLFTLLCSLPSNRLAAKIEMLKAAPQKRSTISQPSFPSLAARQDMGAHDAEMTIGCRLSMLLGSHQEQTPSEEISVTHALSAERDLEANDTQADDTNSRAHYATRTLAAIVTPIGHLELSVVYRKFTDYLIEDAGSLHGANDIKIDLDEDYFRAPQTSEARNLYRPERDVTSPPTVAAGPASEPIADAIQNGDQQRAGQQRMGGISAARPAVLVAQRSSPDSATGADGLTSQSPANPSVFSTSAPGRHSAGLSSLRRTGSTKSNLSLMGPPSSSGVPSSPALAAALSAEPAFMVPSSVRRPSTSERRLQSISGLSSGRPSPPVSPSAASFDLPEVSASVPRSASAAFPYNMTGRSISTRTTSGFAASTSGTMGPPSSTQPRPSVSFSPSSPSPLAQQMSLQGSRAFGGTSLAPTTSQSTSSFRSVSGSGLRSSMSGTGVLLGPSLRSVFQNYVPRSQTASIAAISRTPPTSTSAGTHGSFSPSNLGTGARSTSIRRNSSTSDAGSSSAFGASLTSSSAAAKPQMIKRYSTNFAYRQNRERGGIYGSSLGSEGSGSLGAGAESSSYPRFSGAGGSLSSVSGRSWISRMEQRQGLGTGGAFARTSSLDDATAAASASSASRYRPTSAAAATQLGGGLTPSPRSHEDDMDDLTRLLETRPAFGASSIGKLTSLRHERRNAPGLSSTPEEGGASPAAGHGSDALTDSVQSNLGQDRPSPLSGSSLRSGSGLRTANPMSRSQLDDLLNRMAESVGIMGAKEQGSTTSAEASSDTVPSDVRAPSGSYALATPLQPASRPLTPAQVSATLGKGRGSTGKVAEKTADSDEGQLSSPATFARALPSEAGMRPRSAVGYQVRAYGTAAVERTASDSAAMVATERAPRDLTAANVQANVGSAAAAAAVAAAAAAHASSPTASVEQASMPDYEAEGDLMFKVDGQQDYDPEDELPGEMEMMPEERGGAIAALRVGDTAATAFGGGVEGGMGATLPVGAHRDSRAHDWHASDRWERARAQEAERRRVDAEMSRTFGQEVGASTRGRGSHSPWRGVNNGSTSQQPQQATVPSTSSGANPVGFRSSSTRPFAGGNRLVGGVGVGTSGLSPSSGASMNATTADGRRGYGVSAPSTHFHYQPRMAAKSGAQSYPASRDELYDDDEDAEEEDD